MLFANRIRHGNFATHVGFVLNPVDGSDAAHRAPLGYPASVVKRPSVSVTQGKRGRCPSARRTAECRKGLAHLGLPSGGRSWPESEQPATEPVAETQPAAIWATLVMCRALGR